MMHKINLSQYVKMGGNVNKLFLPSTSTRYFDKNQNKPISKIELGRITQSRTRLYKVTYEDGNSHEYAGSWIETEVKLVLENKYL